MGITCIVPFFAFGQYFNLPLNHEFSFDLNQSILQSDSIIHSSFRPLLESTVKKVGRTEDLSPTLYSPSYQNRSFVARKLFLEHFITLDTGNIHLTIDPLFNFEFGVDGESDPRGDLNYYKNTRGFNVKLRLGDKVNVESSFRETQAVLPFYLNQRVRDLGVAYGQGRTKAFEENGFDFSMASAYVSYSPSKRFNIQVGHGKHFIGNGYRSILLSDLAFNYPYLRMNSNWLENKIQYQNLFTIFQDLNRVEREGAAEALFERKQGAFHYLEYSPNNKLSIALFEGSIFPSLDTTGNIDVGANFWVPLIGLNTLIENNNEGRTRLGTNLSYRLGQKIQLYNQFVVENTDFNKLSHLWGVKWFAYQSLLLQAEYNTVEQNFNSLFNHFNESLSVPNQSDYQEILGIAQYKRGRWVSRSAFTYGKGDFSSVRFFDFRQSYIINPSFNFTINVGVQLRRRKLELENSINSSVVFIAESPSSNFIYFGLSTNLQNLYFNY